MLMTLKSRAGGMLHKPVLLLTRKKLKTLRNYSRWRGGKQNRSRDQSLCVLHTKEPPIWFTLDY